MEDGEGRIDLHGSYVPSLLHSSSQRGKTWSMCITGGLRSLCDVSQPLADSQVMSVVTEARLELLTLVLFHLCTILIVEHIPGPEFLEV